MFGDLALDEAFTDRENELRELTSDMLNGQNAGLRAAALREVAVVLRAAQDALRKKAWSATAT